MTEHFGMMGVPPRFSLKLTKQILKLHSKTLDDVSDEGLAGDQIAERVWAEIIRGAGISRALLEVYLGY